MAVIDADCIAGKDWLINLTTAIGADKVRAAAGTVVSFDRSGWIEHYVDHNGTFYSQYGAFQEGRLSLPRIGAGNVIYDREVFNEIGMFDTIFMNCEDHDFTMRMALAGIDFEYVTTQRCTTNTEIIYRTSSGGSSNETDIFFVFT